MRRINKLFLLGMVIVTALAMVACGENKPVNDNKESANNTVEKYETQKETQTSTIIKYEKTDEIKNSSIKDGKLQIGNWIITLGQTTVKELVDMSDGNISFVGYKLIQDSFPKEYAETYEEISLDDSTFEGKMYLELKTETKPLLLYLNTRSSKSNGVIVGDTVISKIAVNHADCMEYVWFPSDIEGLDVDELSSKYSEEKYNAKYLQGLYQEIDYDKGIIVEKIKKTEVMKFDKENDYIYDQVPQAGGPEIHNNPKQLYQGKYIVSFYGPYTGREGEWEYYKWHK